MATLPELLSLLRQKLGYECVEQLANPSHIRLFGRIRGQSYGNAYAYGRMLLRERRSVEWTADVSMEWVTRGEDDKLAGGLRFMFQGGDNAQMIDWAMRLLQQSPVAQATQIDSVPLPGAPADRNSPTGPGHKGATLHGQTIIGAGRR